MAAPWRSPLRRGWTRVDPPQQPVLVVNPRSGGGRAARAHLADQARARGIEVVVLTTDASLEAIVADAVAGGADALGVAGGDGSLAVAAAATLAHGIPFVCIPAGTRNHFALDVGVDRHDLVGALEAFSDGVERRIDVGRLNGQLFLNNVSLGLYGDAVRQPEYREAKVRTLLTTAQAVLAPGGTAPEMVVVDDRGRRHHHPAALIVSNNPYAVHRPVVTGTRPSLTSGRLGIVLLDSPNDTRREGREPGRAWTATTLEIDAPGTLHLGIDGESLDVEPPLLFEILPSALRVRISSRHPGVSPSGLGPRPHGC